MGRTHVGKNSGRRFPVSNPVPPLEMFTGTGGELEEKGAAEKICDELTATLLLHPSALLGEGRKIWSEVEPRRKGEVR